MKWLSISCKEATYLLSKKEEKKLGFFNRLKLNAHLAICSVCRHFDLQTEFMAKQAPHVHADLTLSQEAKDKIQVTLTENK